MKKLIFVVCLMMLFIPVSILAEEIEPSDIVKDEFKDTENYIVYKTSQYNLDVFEVLEIRDEKGNIINPTYKEKLKILKEMNKGVKELLKNRKKQQRKNKKLF